MANTAQVYACGNPVSTANTTQWIGLSGALGFATTETQKQLVFRNAGTLQNLHFYLSSNSVNASTVFTLRKAAANVNQTVTVTTTQTGRFEDSTHTDAVVAADKFDLQSVPGTGSTGTFGLNELNLVFIATTSANTVSRMSQQGSVAWSTASSTEYLGICGTMDWGGTETSSQFIQEKAGTFSNLAINLSANTSTKSHTYTSRKNAVAGAITITVALSSGAGIFEDSTHSDTVAVGDKYCVQFVTGTNTAFTVVGAAIDFVSTAGYAEINNGRVGGAGYGISQNQFQFPGGATGFTGGTETSNQVKTRAAFVFSLLSCFVSANTVTASSTITFRKNAAAGSQTITYTSSQTGWQTDATHTDTTIATDLVSLNYITGATGTTWTPNQVQMWATIAGQVFTAALTETVAVSDGSTRQAVKKRTSTETTSISESQSRIAIKKRTKTETVAASENLGRQALKKRKLGVGSESYTALSFTTLSYTVSQDEVLVSDAVTAAKIRQRSLTENVTVGAGTISRVKLAVRAIAAETSSISASLSRIRIVPRSLTESKTVGDSIARAKKAVRSLTETKSVSESLARVKKAIRSISETKTVGETLARSRQAIRSITETSAVSSSIARVKTAVRSIATESNSVSDSIARIKKAVRTVYGVTQGNPYALSFVSSSSQYVDLTSNSALAVGETAGSEMSYSVWFRATAHPADPIKGIIMTKGLEGSVIFIDHTTGKLNAQFFYNSTTSNLYTTQSSGDICDSNWHHVVITNSDITHLSKVYLDGIEIGSNNVDTADSTLLTSRAPDYPLTVGLYVEVAGGPPNTLHYPFDGQIDDPRVYNIELTPTEASNLNAGQNVTRGIVGAWNFNEGTGTTAADSTSNHFDGTLTNSPTWYNTPTLPAIGGAGTIAISDSVARIKKAMRSIAAETNAISDSVSAVKSGAHLFTRSITETVTASSSVARIKIAIRAITETKSMAESLARAKISIRSLTETNAASSSVARIRIVVRSITETKAVSDAIARIKVAIRSITETKPISENLARVRLVTRSITETKTVSDSIARIKKSIRSLTETTSISESLARIKHAIRSITETKTIGDSITRTKIVVRTLVETKSISETLARAKLSIRAITETKTISESLTRVKIAIRTIAETKTITDSVSAIKSGGGFFSRSITETVTSSDSISRVKKSVRAITTESSSISENLTRVKVAIRSITETKTISSSVARIRTVPRLIIETKTVGDSVARAKKSVRSLTESNSISSIVVRSSHRIRSLATESVTVGSGTVARLKKSIRVMTESISISESSSRMKKAIRVAIETSNISSSVTGSKLAKFITRAITESVTIAPGTVTKRTPLAVRMLSELVEVFETIRVMGGVPTVDKTIGTRGMTWVWVQRPPNEPQPRPLFAVVNKASASVNINPLRIMGNSALGLIRIDKTKMLAASTISLVASSGVMKGALRLRAISHAAKCSEIRLDKLPSMATAKSKVVDPIKQSRLLKLLRISSLIEMLEKL